MFFLSNLGKTHVIISARVAACTSNDLFQLSISVFILARTQKFEASLIISRRVINWRVITTAAAATAAITTAAA